MPITKYSAFYTHGYYDTFQTLGIGTPALSKEARVGGVASKLFRRARVPSAAESSRVLEELGMAHGPIKIPRGIGEVVPQAPPPLKTPSTPYDFLAGVPTPPKVSPAEMGSRLGWTPKATAPKGAPAPAAAKAAPKVDPGVAAAESAAAATGGPPTAEQLQTIWQKYPGLRKAMITSGVLGGGGLAGYALLSGGQPDSYPASYYDMPFGPEYNTGGYGGY